MFFLHSVKYPTEWKRQTTKNIFFIRNYSPNCLESGIPFSIPGNGKDSNFLKWGSCMVKSRVSTGVQDNNLSWFLFNPRGLLFISGWSWFSLTMGMLWVAFISLSPLHKPALVASILPSQEWHIGSPCCPPWHNWWSYRDNKIYIVLMSASAPWARDWG